MADGRKNEEIKVIKNPLLRQNLLLEEISGISFVVPAVSEKLEAVDNGSSQGLEVSQVGAKTDGSDGKPQETQSFTDIPLDVPEPTEESKPPPSSSASEKQEGTSFGFRSIIPSFVPLLVPQSFKNTPPKEPQDTPPLAESFQTPKRVSTPETVVPQLLPPASSEKSPTLSASLNPIKKDVLPPVSSPTPSASSAASYAGTPPPVTGPPPLASNINRNANINPYALKRQNFSSTVLNSTNSKSQANESPYFMPPPLYSVGTTFNTEVSNSYMTPSFSAQGSYSFSSSKPLIGDTMSSIGTSSFFTSTRDSTSSSPLVSGSSISSVTSNAPSIPSITPAPNIPLYPPVTNMPPVPPISSLTNMTPASSFTNAPPAPFLSNMQVVPPVSSLSSMPVAPSLTNMTPTSSINNTPSASFLSNMPSVSSISSMPLAPPLTNMPALSSIINAPPAPSLSNLPPAPPLSNLPPAPPLSNLPLAPSLSNLPPAPSLSNLPPAPSLSNLPPAPSLSSVPPAPSLSNLPPAPSLSSVPPAPSLSNLPPAPPLSSVPPAPSLCNLPPAPPPSNLPPASSLSNLPPAPSLSNLPPAPPLSNLPPAPPLSNLPPAPPLSNLPPAPSLSNLPPAPSLRNLPPAPLLSNLPPAPSLSNLPPAPSQSNLPSAPSLSNLPPAPSLSSVPPSPSLSSLSPAPSLSNLPPASSQSNLSLASSVSNVSSAPSIPPFTTAPHNPHASSILSSSNMPSASFLPPTNILPPISSNPLAGAVSSIPGISPIANSSSILSTSASLPLINSSNSGVGVPVQTEKDSSSYTSDKNTEQITLTSTTTLTHPDSDSICNSNDSFDKDKSEASKLQNIKEMASNSLPSSKESSNAFSGTSVPLSSSGTIHFKADISPQAVPQSSPNPELVPFSVSNSIMPPPISNIINSGSANPYTLKKGQHSSPYVSKERIVSPSPNASTAPLFSHSPYSLSSSSILSGPGVSESASASILQQLPSTNQSGEILDSKNGNLQNVQFPLVKNFASAISNFISPSKQSNDSIVENKLVISPQDSNNELSSINDNYNMSSLAFSFNQPESLSTPSVQYRADQNTSLSNNIQCFNTSNVVNNNGFGLNPSNIITDNTVCVSAITTALSSVAPSTGILTTPSTQVDASYSSTHLASQVYDIKQTQTFSSVYSLQNQQTTAFNNNFFNNNLIDNQTQNTNSLSNIHSEQNNSAMPTSTNPIENNSKLNLQSENSCTSQTNKNNDYITSKPETIILKEEQKNNILQDTSKNKVNFPGTVPVIQPIPTFNYFSTSNLPMPDKGSFFQTKQIPELPTSSFFKPIESPNISAGAFLSQNPPHSSQGYQNVPYTNPLPAALPKISFPPPNTTIPPKIATKTPPKSEPEKSETKSDDKLDFEELDQIPLEGSAVPLYRPDYLSQKKKAESPGEVGNSYRLSGGLKKPTYAPVPELGLTGRKSYPEPSRSNSLSSQEEMAAIEAQSARVSPPHGKTSPSTSTTLDTYYSDLLAAPSYRPPYHHWFFKSGQHKKSPWTPFSMADSLNLEQIYTSSEVNEGTKVPTDGGRYDVEIIHRKRTSVYWEEPPGEVRRCSWFVKSITDSRYTPYDENIAALLEDEYKKGCESSEWNRRLELADGEVIILHSPTAMAHHVRSSSPDAWGTQPTLQQKPRVVKRGVDDFNIAKGEPKQVDHLLLMVHGVGKACDLRFRSLVEVVDDFRSIAQQLVGSHFHSGVENGNVGRVEILPVEWHGALHTEAINDRLSAITLPSIPRAREFTNETLLDILFYTSPVFAETIVQAVGEELNRVFTLYKARNPGFRGQVSLGGHSLGSLILFDILCHQQIQRAHFSTQSSLQCEDDEAMDELGCLQTTKAKLNRRMSYLTIGPGTGQPYTIYPQLSFHPRNFFALGSPIGMFVTVRGLETLGEDFKFPTCPSFFNIFHPNDPVAYRIEALIKPEMATVPAVLIPHHKGRKRMHLELKETMAHVTAALKQKLVDSMKNTWNAVYHLTLFNKKDNSLQGEVNQVIEDEVMRDLDSDPPLSVIGEEGAGTDVKVGKLNRGRRVDYVLQEAPLETFNQYISAIRSHLVYWESEDTTLMILKEIYGGMGISPDTQVPQAILPFDLAGEADSYSDYTYSIGALPTQFIRK